MHKESKIKIFLTPKKVEAQALKKMGFILDKDDPEKTLYTWEVEDGEISYDLNKFYFIAKGNKKGFVDMANRHKLVIREI